MNLKNSLIAAQLILGLGLAMTAQAQTQGIANFLKEQRQALANPSDGYVALRPVADEIKSIQATLDEYLKAHPEFDPTTCRVTATELKEASRNGLAAEVDAWLKQFKLDNASNGSTGLLVYGMTKSNTRTNVKGKDLKEDIKIKSYEDLKNAIRKAFKTFADNGMPVEKVSIGVDTVEDRFMVAMADFEDFLKTEFNFPSSKVNRVSGYYGDPVTKQVFTTEGSSESEARHSVFIRYQTAQISCEVKKPPPPTPTPTPIPTPTPTPPPPLTQVPPPPIEKKVVINTPPPPPVVEKKVVVQVPPPPVVKSNPPPQKSIDQNAAVFISWSGKKDPATNSGAITVRSDLEHCYEQLDPLSKHPFFDRSFRLLSELQNNAAVVELRNLIESESRCKLGFEAHITKVHQELEFDLKTAGSAGYNVSISFESQFVLRGWNPSTYYRVNHEYPVDQKKWFNLSAETTMGSDLSVYIKRLERILSDVRELKIKCGL